MDPAAASSDSPPQRAPSSEPGSTRPNPFDDGDVASRKRRRTSGSADSLNQFRDRTSLSPTGHNDELVASDQAMAMDHDPSTPRTPEASSSDASQHAAPPSSSKVTINLRKTASADDEGSTPPPLPDRIDPTFRDRIAADKTAASLDADVIQVHPIEGPTPPTSSSSPPVELIEDREDDDLDIQNTIEDISLGGHSVDLSDEILSFPYKDASEHPCETVDRLVVYLASPQLELRILLDVSNWVRRYVDFGEIAGPQRRDEAFSLHSEFFIALSKTPGAMLNRRPPLHNVPRFSDVILSFYHDYTRLAKCLVERDLRKAHECQASLVVGEKTLPQLLSPKFLDPIAILVQFETDSHEAEEFSSEGELFVDQLEGIFGTGFQNVHQLMNTLLDILPALPSLLDGLASCVSSLVCLNNSASFRLIRAPHNTANQDRVATYLSKCHELWPAMATCFHNMIDKNVTQIDKNAVLRLTDRLAALVRLCGMEDRVQDFQGCHPELPTEWVREAMSLEWRFDTLGKLIRCSQMQLRVAGASNMCQTLVNLWKQFEEEPRHPVLQHMAAYLNRSSIIEYILGPNSHPAIINESSNIVGFLAVTKTYDERHTDQLWQAFASSQDPRAADALVRLIVGITNLLDLASVGDLCAKLDTRPFSDFTPSIRNLFEHIIKRMLEKAVHEQQPLTYQPYGLCLRLLRESTLVAQDGRTPPPEMHTVLMQRLRELIRAGPEDHRTELYQSCLHDVSSKSETTLGSLWCLSLAVTVPSAIESEMEILTREHNLAQLLVEEIDHTVVSGSASRAGSVLCGHINRPRMQLLTHLLRHQPSAIGDGLGEKLWDVMVGPRCPYSQDREVGWGMLNQIRGGNTKNPYVRSCFSNYLPKLPTDNFCEGTLKFIREEILHLLKQTEELHLDDEASLRSSCLEQLWRLVLEAPDRSLAARAIHTLAREVYIESAIVTGYPPLRARQVHSAFVNRCLSHLKESASSIKELDHSEVMVVEGKAEKQERIFIRSLQLLTYFLAAHQGNSHFSAPDLRPFMSQTPSEVEGDLVQLKYQSFDGIQQTGVKPLHIGRFNTAASLLASIRQETGFPNYRAYYRGQPFLPSERDICKSLEDLHIHDGLILVKREEEDRSGSFRYKPGSSPLQGEILDHFQEMAGYLEMKDTLANEVYEFLCKLPAHMSVIETFEDSTKSHADIFPPEQPYRCLYAAHALFSYKSMVIDSVMSSSDPKVLGRESYETIRRRVISLLVQAIQDARLVPLKGAQLELELLTALLRNLVVWSTDRTVTQQAVKDTEFGLQSPEKFISILSMALSSTEKQAEGLTMQAFPALLMLGHHDSKLWDSIASSTPFKQLFSRLILYDTRQSLRMRTYKFIQSFNETESQGGRMLSLEQLGRGPEAQHRISRWFWAIGVQLLQDSSSRPSQCSELMSLVLTLTNNLMLVRRDLVDLHALAELASGLLLEHETTEDIDQAAPFDPVPRGLALILLKCLQNDESIAHSPLLRRDIVFDLFWRHLFPQTRGGFDQAVPRVVLNSDTRQKICDVLLLLSKSDREHYVTLLQCLNEILPFSLNDEDDSHYLYEIPCNFDRSKALRASCGYAGLRNLSNTCYLNSLLTQLYMNTGFRQFLMAAAVEHPGDKQALLKETKKVFGFLQESYHRFIDPEDFVSAIQQYDGGPIDIHNQMDVDEFYNLLFDRMEAQLVDGDARKQFREFYGGQLVQQIKSKECSHISERLESFSAIQLDIKGKRCLEESLQTYIEGEVLEGDNKYKCSTCDNHVDAVKRACLKDLPDNVIFHLKRFDFNLFTLQRSKINDYFSFPEKIDLNPYTVEHLSDPTSGEPDVFELVGVLVHTGTSESGHYYSYIRERPSNTESPRWFEFNDDVVSEWDPANMEASAFGGPDHRPPFDTNGVVYDKAYSAYMLFYERASKLREQEQQVAASATPVPVRVTMDSPRRSYLWDENTQLLRRHCLFDPTHFQFVKQAFELLPEVQQAHASRGSPATSTNNGTDDQEKSLDHSMETSSQESQGSPATLAADGSQDVDSKPAARSVARNMQSETLQDLAMEVALSHLDQAVSHTKEIPGFAIFMGMLDQAISQCVEAAHSYYRYFYLRPAAFRSLLQRNIEPAVRLGVGKQFLGVLQKIAADAPQHYTLSHALSQRPIGVPVLNGVMHILRYLWSFFHCSIRAWDEYFAFILGFARMGDMEVAHLLAEDYLFKLGQIILADRCLELPQQFGRMLSNIDRRNNGNRPASYRELLCLLHYLFLQMDPTVGRVGLVENTTDRLSQQSPFSWSTTESNLLHFNPEDREHSFFVEKLLKLEERQRFIDPVVVCLTQRSEVLDRSVAIVLSQTTVPNASSMALEANLQLAGLYLATTRLPESAEDLISHITVQLKGFHHEDIPAAFDFFQASLRLRRTDSNLTERLRMHSLSLAPAWAPILLAQLNSVRREELLEMLDYYLFGSDWLEYPLDFDFEEDDSAQRQFEEMLDIVRRLGIGCLQFLRDVHVLGDNVIGRAPADALITVTRKSKQYFEEDTEHEPDRIHKDFLALQEEITEPLRRLIVDYVDDDGTDWDASSHRSDQMDGMTADMNLQVMNELNDTNGA